MIQINDVLLNELGLGALPNDEKRALLNHIYETLELRVGMRLADQMTNEQLDEFEKYFEAKDEKGAFSWLETNFPNYKEIVQQEFDKLKAEVAQSAPQILGAAQNPASPVMPQGQSPTPTLPPANPQDPYGAQQYPPAGSSDQGSAPDMPAQPPQQPPMSPN